MRRFPSSLLQFTPRDRLPTFFALGMLVGAIWYFSIPFEPSLWAVLIAVCGLVVLVALALRSGLPAIVFAATLMGLGSGLGVLAGSLATQRLSHVQIDNAVGPVLLEGWVQAAEPARRGVRLVIRVHAIDGLPNAKTPKTVRVTHILALETEPGRFVRCWAVLRPPPAPVIEGDYQFDRQAWYEGLGGVGYVQGRCRGGTLGRPEDGFDSLDLQIGKIRRLLAQHVHQAAGERAGGFAAALASGDRSFLKTEDQDALRGSGLAHLLAISGLHIGIVGGLVYLVIWRGLSLIEPVALRWTVRKPAAALALLTCGAYLVVSGASVSTQRAFAMALVFFGAVLVDRAALTQRSLALAMILIITIAPWSVLTPGFQMSFAATLALITTYETWQQRRRQKPGRSRGRVFWAQSLVVTSMVTSLATLPYALYHFERAAGLGVVANILAMPIISLLSAPSAALALALAPFGLDAIALRAFGGSLEWVLAIAHTLDAEAGARVVQVHKMPAVSLACFSAALVCVCVLRASRIQLILVGFLIVSAFAIWGAQARDRVHWAPSGDVFLEHAGGAIERIAFLDGDGLGPLRFADQSIAQSCEDEGWCVIEFGDARIEFVAPENTEPCLWISSTKGYFAAPEPLSCPTGPKKTVIGWSEVQAENGVTLEKRADRFRKRAKPTCGKRPWRRCSERRP